MKKQNFQLYDVLLLSFILLLTLVFRLYRINTPLADLHSWRQADTAAVARNFVRNGIDLLHPRYDDLSGRESGKENPQGYRMVEFPLYNGIFSTTYKLFPFMPVEVHGRLTTVLSSLIIIGIIYYLVFKENGRLPAVIASLTYAIFPFFVFFSRVVLPETTALAFTLTSILFLYLSNEKKIAPTKETVFFIISFVSFTFAILIKPTVIFYSVVLFYLLFQKYNFNFFKKINFYIYFAAAFLPFVLWRLYIRNFPEGVPVSDWLITSVNTYEGLKSIFFRPAFFRWIFFERINNIIFGGYLTIFFLLGLLRKNKKIFFHTFLLANLLYLFTFQGGNVQHEYYQILILPTLAIFTGLGIQFLLTIKKDLLPPLILYLIIALIFIFSFYFSFYRVRDYYNYPQDLAQIAKIIKTLSRNDDKIVTDTTGDSTLLYLSDRKGAPSLYKDPPTLQKLGYNYMIIFNKDYAEELKKDFSTVFENDKFLMFKL
ncbi:hypothetical protein A3A46_00300 [Candidatus Roizmanbacteria bacterium RIFCSPLOWO2_01_FULL_37_13]|uniref:Glycosyltransferase RgtA/B/C/D-like domain-containing protein n=1 Tax=Candidatus Roizmanbacteria bacterium RIFCSPHIGHO2_02_FULL_38_11 TaxID=1802039 RepID=A0A1F7H3K9_9BACT|nr:MAG: hypothetical protein A3C25_02935 [Candidatus Roizmanbacteria bacterium RIFCSPHIGHO2_02_FULL_38_11]OGK34669.1 MAG: hypothetical protein A3F58_03090 [Candidatus Roizmanbacteria bacterium RIFCSPHIGHO2_12_FULL_37_9b]OGK42336.1 MAG: hypothetical protein A3A46_00300 [Candidatus Roizmanbacteria bacterium RIFCSPLOWO2_01_FULL_37_13]